MNAVSIPGSEELEVLSPSCIEIVQDSFASDDGTMISKRTGRLCAQYKQKVNEFLYISYATWYPAQNRSPMDKRTVIKAGKEKHLSK
ncbi:hypothetical protein AVEN_18289-1 [Araneus ventricosus]|uniref:Uncharacterized protein n=1 Tax=Araneus ventricosus TaxID=182803 RepID=A0A4Y2S206_ARAVE|nr:hypothetical protein AVEN_18289-1 [Araneus ventricosus]